MFAPNRTLSGSACRAAIVSGRLAFALNLDGSGDEQAWRIDRGDELYKALRTLRETSLPSAGLLVILEV